MITYIKLVQKGKNILKIGQKSQACVTHWGGQLLESHSECVRNGRSAGVSCLKGMQMYAVVRSEERRVGKECRSRWSPYH